MFNSLPLDEALLAAVDGPTSVHQGLLPYATGFRPLDGYLGDGLRPRELTLVAGRQGVGKTTFVLQVCRHVATTGTPVVLVSFEHDEHTLVERFLALEIASQGGGAKVPARRVVERLRGRHVSATTDGDTQWSAALAAVQGWGGRVQLVGPSVDTPTVTMEDIVRVIEQLTELHGRAPLLVVDYLQKLATTGENDDERSGRVAVALKELAMSVGVPVLAITAADREGLVGGRRLRIHHLRGASVLAYEADVVLLFNDKYDVVSRQQLVYDAPNAARLHDVTVISIEKNRGGLDNIDLEFRKHFESNRFDPEGAVVKEQLVDERLYD